MGRSAASLLVGDKKGGQEGGWRTIVVNTVHRSVAPQDKVTPC